MANIVKNIVDGVADVIEDIAEFGADVWDGVWSNPIGRMAVIYAVTYGASQAYNSYAAEQAALAAEGAAATGATADLGAAAGSAEGATTATSVEGTAQSSAYVDKAADIGPMVPIPETTNAASSLARSGSTADLGVVANQEAAQDALASNIAEEAGPQTALNQAANPQAVVEPPKSPGITPPKDTGGLFDGGLGEYAKWQLAGSIINSAFAPDPTNPNVEYSKWAQKNNKVARGWGRNMSSLGRAVANSREQDQETLQRRFGQSALRRAKYGNA